MVADTQQSSAHAAHFTSAVYSFKSGEFLGETWVRWVGGLAGWIQPGGPC